MAIGVGLRPGAAASDVTAAVAAVLAVAGATAGQVQILATLATRVDEPAVVAVAARFGWQRRGYPAAELATTVVPHPSTVVRAAVGTASVAEAAALRAAADLARVAAMVPLADGPGRAAAVTAADGPGRTAADLTRRAPETVLLVPKWRGAAVTAALAGPRPGEG